ncbi:MAG TPA: hypothetical protein VL574_00850 [Stellaceae bacterium]|nr:hypothetical protein [Stellaceae bacterium]
MSDPTPQDRAELIVLKLEHFIRDNRTVRGVPYRDWQALARSELTEAFVEVAELSNRKSRDVVMKRMLLLGSSALITVGFWGAVVAIDTHYAVTSAIIMFLAGLALLAVVGDFGIRAAWKRGTAAQRPRRFRRIKHFDAQLRRLEHDMQKRLKKLKAEAEAEAEKDAQHGA